MPGSMGRHLRNKLELPLGSQVMDGAVEGTEQPSLVLLPASRTFKTYEWIAAP